MLRLVRRLLLALLALLAALLALALSPAPLPAVRADPRRLPAVPAEPAALDAWLAAREARFDDITPGAEQGVVWADPERPARTPLALVYLHGYSATRQEVSPLVEEVAAKLGANAFFARLRGHGRTGEAFAEATAADWLDDGVLALAVGHAIGDRVVLVGTSTGGTLACWLAAHGADPAAMVLISPNFGPRAAGAWLLGTRARGLLTRLVVGETRAWEPANPEQARYWTHRYPSRALFPMNDLVRLTERADFRAIRAPTLALVSPGDRVVRSERVAPHLARMGSAVTRLVEVTDSGDPSQHVLAGRILSPGNTARLAGIVEDFLRDVLPAAP